MSDVHYHIGVYEYDSDRPSVDLGIKSPVVAAIIWQQAIRALPGGWRRARWHASVTPAELAALAVLNGGLSAEVGCYVVCLEQVHARCCATVASEVSR